MYTGTIDYLSDVITINILKVPSLGTIDKFFDAFLNWGLGGVGNQTL